MSFRNLLKYWFPVVCWMALIFYGSTGALSTQNTSRIIGPLLRWISPSITDDTVRTVQFTIRKCGHVTEYAILALLIWRALRQPVRGDTRPWTAAHARAAVLIAFAYACSDELHQAFEPTRQGSILDVMIDTLGATLAVVILWKLGKSRNWWGIRGS